MMTDAKVAVITGGTSGIGAATAIRFARGGYRVAVCGRDESRLARSTAALRQAVTGVDCLPLAADMSEPESSRQYMARVQEHFGRLDILVNCAGYAHLARFDALAPQEYVSLIRSNLDATFFSCQAAIRYLRLQSRGVIVNVSSQAAVDPYRGFAVYGACKAWVEHLTAALATELAETSIAVFAIRPGAVETPMLRGAFPDFPTERALSASDVADVVWQLADPTWRYSTGMIVPVRLS